MSYSQLVSDAERTVGGLRDGAIKAASSGRSSPNAMYTSAVAPYATSGIAGNEQSEFHARQYNAAHRDWAYVAIRPICVKFADLQVRCGYRETPESAAGKPKSQKSFEHVKIFENAPEFITKESIDNVEIIDNHDILMAIENPNEYMVQWSLMYCTAFSLQATGKCYWWIDETKPTYNSPGRIKIWYVPASWVTPVHEKGKMNARFMVRPPGTTEGFPVDDRDMIYFSFPNPGSPTDAMAPLQTQARAVNTDEQIQKAQLSSMQNSLNPGMVITAGRLENSLASGTNAPRPVLTPEQRSQLIEAIKLAYRGVQHHGDPIIVDGLIESVTPYTLKPADLDFPEGSKLTKDRIMQGIGTNPVMAGAIEGVNRASSAVAQEVFYANVVNPLVTLVSQTLTVKLAPRFAARRTTKAINTPPADRRLLVWGSKAEAFDADLTLSKYTFAADHDALSRNEIREYVGLKPTKNPKDDEPPEPQLATPAPGMGPINPKPNSGAAPLPKKQPAKKKRLTLQRMQSVFIKTISAIVNQKNTVDLPRDFFSRWRPATAVGRTYTPEQIISKVKAQPGIASDFDWDSYAEKWGIANQEFEGSTCQIADLWEMVEKKTIGISSKVNIEAVNAKVESGDLHPIVITRPAGQSTDLVIVDGTHSLLAAVIRYKQAYADSDKAAVSRVEIIVSNDAAAYLGIPFGQKKLLAS